MRSQIRSSIVAVAWLVLVVPVLVADMPPADTNAYGNELTIEQATQIAAIVESPESFDGREVRVEGEVRGVCAKAGCWMEIADGAGHAIRIKVDDGVIVFPQDAVGAEAVAQGTVTVKEMSRDEYVGWQRHLAEEMGQDFDESVIGDGPYQLVQIAGSGARIGS